MKKPQGHLIVAVLFLLVAVVHLLLADTSNVQLSDIVLSGIWLLGSLVSFWQYRKYRKGEEHE